MKDALTELHQKQNKIPPKLISAMQAIMGLASKSLIVTIEDMATHLVHIDGTEQKYDLWLMQVSRDYKG